jgi:hypothetical protein
MQAVDINYVFLFSRQYIKGREMVKEKQIKHCEYVPKHYDTAFHTSQGQWAFAQSPKVLCVQYITKQNTYRNSSELLEYFATKLFLLHCSGFNKQLKTLDIVIHSIVASGAASNGSRRV